MARGDKLWRLCLVWMLVTVYGVSCIHPPPTIIRPPTTSGGETIVQTDEEISLECRSPLGPVTWDHPQAHEEISNEESYEYRIDTNEKGNNYWAKLTVTKAQYYHTGLYSCSYTVDNDSNFAATSEIYVYVFDENHLLVQSDEDSSYDLINVSPGGEAIVPCRPTSPHVNMTLFDSRGNEIYSCNVTNTCNDNVTYDDPMYDPRQGFIFKRIKIPPDSPYECNATYGNVTKIIPLYFFFESNPDSVPTPIIEGDSHAIINEKFTLTCKVYRENNVALIIRWINPSGENVSNDSSDRVYVGNFEKITENDAEYAALTLTVKGATRLDAGTYRCEAQYGSGSSKNHADIDVHILGEGESFIDLVIQGNKSTIQAHEGIAKSVQWIVDIHAHPKPTVTWSAHTNLDILSINGTVMCDNSANNAHRYWSTTTDTKTKLTICHPRVSDTGRFTLTVANTKRETLNVELNVSGAPEVILRQNYNPFPLYGENMNLSCTVSSNPKSRIYWIFHECDFRPDENCFAQEARQLVDATEVEELDTVVHSDLRWTAIRTGLIVCKACNRNVSSNEEMCSMQSGKIIVSDLPDGFGVTSPEVVIEGDEQVNISCAASMFVYEDSLQWTQTSPVRHPDVAAIPGFSVFHRKSPRSYIAEIQIEKAKLSHTGTYECIAQRSDGLAPDTKAVSLTVLPMTKPKITDTSFNQTKRTQIPVGFQFNLYCRASGVPEPEILWYKDQREIKPKDKRFTLTNGNRKLTVTNTVTTDEGTYECQAVNRAGKDMQSTQIVLSNDLSKYVYIGIVAFALILIAVIVYLVIRIKKEKEQRKRLMEAGLLDFEKGAVENLDPHLSVDEQAERLPYDPDFEFPRNKLKLGKVLGSGAFGVVLKGEAYGLLREDEGTPVAVKMVKKNADGSILRALTSELKILIHLGRHLNVVNLLGACTKCINKMELLVIVEYCRYGNLQNYLLRHRKAFVNQVDRNTGKIDYSIQRCHAGNRRLKYATLSFHSSSQSNSLGDDMKDYRSDYGENLVSGATDITTVSMTPTGAHEESSLMSNNSNQPEWRSNYTGDYKDNVEPITTEDLVCFAFQVARGMDYLASRKVLHGDLAARNILLADNRVVKICDFGLARTMYKDETYRKKENGPLPIKWMAIESLRDRVFSTQSDVWSFGIVLWEFFTLSKTPYPGTEPNQTFLEKLEEGYRMEKPPYSPDEVYDLMMSCWRARPTLRPSFSELADSLGALLNEDVRNLYIEMNRPYIEKNTAWMEGTGKQDYLAMVNAPVYDNMTSPLPVDDDPRISSPIPRTPGVGGFPPTLQDGYVVMRSPTNSVYPTCIFSPTRISGSNGGSVFKFNPPPRTLSSPDEEHIELRPMLSGGSQRSESANENESNTDAYLEPRNNRPVHPSNKFSCYPGETVVDSLSNPSYLMAPTLNTSKDNYINYPQPIDTKYDGRLWPRNTGDLSKSSPIRGRPDLLRPAHLDLDQDVKLPPSYINIPSQRRGFAMPNNDEVTYANMR